MTGEKIIGWRNRPTVKPIAPARPSGHARAKAALLKALPPNTNTFMTPLNLGPLMVRRGTGQNASH